MTKKDLEQMRRVDVRTADRTTLVDCRDIQLNPAQGREERIRSYLSQIKNPYCFRNGDMVIKISFMDTDVTLEERLEEYVRNL